MTLTGIRMRFSRLAKKKEPHHGLRGGFWNFRGEFTEDPDVPVALIYKNCDISGAGLTKIDYYSFIVKRIHSRHFSTSAVVFSAEFDTNMP